MMMTRRRRRSLTATTSSVDASCRVTWAIMHLRCTYIVPCTMKWSYQRVAPQILADRAWPMSTSPTFVAFLHLSPVHSAIHHLLRHPSLNASAFDQARCLHCSAWLSHHRHTADPACSHLSNINIHPARANTSLHSRSYPATKLSPRRPAMILPTCCACFHSQRILQQPEVSFTMGLLLTRHKLPATSRPIPSLTNHQSRQTRCTRDSRANFRGSTSLKMQQTWPCTMTRRGGWQVFCNRRRVTA